MSIKPPPSVENIAQSKAFQSIIEVWGRQTVVGAIRTIQNQYRQNNTLVEFPSDPMELASKVEEWLSNHRPHGYTRVFNLTGTILHTNLGRAMLSESIANEVAQLATTPLTVEYDLKKGRRGGREDSIKTRLTALTNAESATVVNNNAAAVFLVLNALAMNQSVLVSRGELIEIGGSFRLPDIMRQANVNLVEVGTTNRTHPSDYESAIDDNVAIILKVHPSNYSIEGFTSEVSTKELGKIAQKHGIPLCVDLGSGALTNLKRFGVAHEPLPSEVLADGADIVTFSGDKLLGGPQAGLIVGKRQILETIDSNPLKRVVRLGKLTLSALDLVLKAYEDPDRLTDKIPLMATLNTTTRELQSRAQQVQRTLNTRLNAYQFHTIESQCQLGSGSLPNQTLDSIAVAVSHESNSEIRLLEARLRNLPLPVISRIKNDRLILDMMGATPIDELIRSLDNL